MPAAVERWIESEGLRLRAVDWGPPAAPAVILLHGSSAHAHWWDFFAPSLAGDFRPVALDLRGHGDSAHMAPPAYSLERYAADVAALVRALELPSVRVVGHSLGALVAAVFAASSPVPVEALVLVDIRLRAAARRRSFLDRLRQFPHPVYASPEEAVRRFRLLPTGNGARPDVLAHVATRALRRLDDGRWTLKFDRETLRDAIPREVIAELQSLRCPILWMRGEQSSLVPARIDDDVRELLPRAEIAAVAGAHHHVMLDAPEAFREVVEGFLRRHAPPR